MSPGFLERPKPFGLKEKHPVSLGLTWGPFSKFWWKHSTALSGNYRSKRSRRRSNIHIYIYIDKDVTLFRGPLPKSSGFPFGLPLKLPKKGKPQ